MKITGEMCEVFTRAYDREGQHSKGVEAGLEAVAAMVNVEAMPAPGQPGVVLVSAELWRQVQQDMVRLRLLEAGGVDNWEGYDAAMAGLRHG